MISADQTGGHAHPVAAWIGDHEITVASVGARECALRAGPYASRLPVRRTPQGRNVVRWIVQLIAAEQIIKTEACRRQVPSAPPSIPAELDIGSALELGGVLATILASVPMAGAVREAVTAAVDVDIEDVRAYYTRNIDQFTLPESRQLDRLVDGHRRTWGHVVRGELPADWESRIFAAETDVPITVDFDRVFVVRAIRPGNRQDFDAVRDSVAAKLREHRRNTFFADWMQQEQRRWLRLAPGFEHPGDPHQADATHRH